MNKVTGSSGNIRDIEMRPGMKEKFAAALEPAHAGDSLSRSVDTFIISLIFLNVLAVILESVAALAESYAVFFRVFEIFSIAIFTIEYGLRIWTCTVKKRFSKPVSGRLRYAFTPLALIDFMAIIPFYLPIILGVDLRFLRALRLFRLFTLFKLMRYSHSLDLIGKVVKEKKEELLVTFAGTMLLLVLASGIIYFIENAVQPEAFSSIPAAMWWGVSTMTTVGYGDIYPITSLGKLFGGIVAILGLGTFGLPAGIIAYGFIEEIQNHRYRPVTCPHCEKEIELPVERRRPTNQG